MKNKILFKIILCLFLHLMCWHIINRNFGTGVTIAMDPRTLGTQIDDSIMDKNLDAKLISTNKNYLLNVKTKIIDGRILLLVKLIL